VRLDEGEEEESEVTQEARARIRGGEKEREETQGSRATNKNRRTSLLRRVHTHKCNETHEEPHRFRIDCG